MLDAAGFEPLQLRDDLLRRAEQRRVVELKGVLILLDVRIALGAGAAREIADILEHLPAGEDRPFALLVVVHDLQPASHADHHRVVRPAGPFAFTAERRNTLDDQIGRRNLIEEQIVALARGAADRFRAAGTEPERRVRLLDRARLDDDVVETPALAVVRKPPGARPGLAYDG